MLTFLLLVILLVVAGLCWISGFWSCVVTLINALLSAMIALNYFEPIAAALTNGNRSYVYIWDVVVFWGLFAFTFGFLRIFTDLLSRQRVKFDIWVEMIGRTITSLWIGYVFVGLFCVSLHIGPLPPHPFGSFQKEPYSANFFGLSPGRQWFAFMQSRSLGALSQGSKLERSRYPEDKGKRVFDPHSEYILKYYHRRVRLQGESNLRVN